MSGLTSDVEVEAIIERLTGMPDGAAIYEGVPQGFELPVDGHNRFLPYRDIDFSQDTTSIAGRTVGTNEQDQPHIAEFQVWHVAPTRTQARRLAQATDRRLIGWAPNETCTTIRPFWSFSFGDRDDSGIVASYTLVRFYQFRHSGHP